MLCFISLYGLDFEIYKITTPIAFTDKSFQELTYRLTELTHKLTTTKPFYIGHEQHLKFKNFIKKRLKINP